MALIVPAQELGLRATVAMQKQKMLILGGVNHCELTLPQHHVEEFAVPVGANLDFDWRRLSDGPRHRAESEPEARWLVPAVPAP